MRVRAAVLRQMGLPMPYAESRPLSIEEVELAGPGPGEILVEVRAAGLCHSDLSAINGDRPWPMPIVIGHEAAAEVVGLGAGVDDLAVGDHVVLIFRPNCGSCISCATGRPALCGPGGESNAAGALLGGYRRLRAVGGGSGIGGEPDGVLNHHLGCAAFAEFATVSHRSAVRIDPDLRWDEAALFGCAVLTGAGFGLKGSYVGSCVPARDVPRFIALYRAGRLPVDRLLSERITLDEINPALDRLARGESIRQIVTMH